MSLHLGFYQAGVEVFWRKQELARASDNVSSRNEALNRIPALLPRFRRDWNMGGCRLFESLPSSDLSGSRLSVENILDYISNNLNQLAKKKKNTRFLLLCLALTFLQPWLNRQERVVKLNLRNKNRSFGTSQTHTAGAPKSLLFFSCFKRCYASITGLWFWAGCRELVSFIYFSSRYCCGVSTPDAGVLWRLRCKGSHRHGKPHLSPHRTSQFP